MKRIKKAEKTGSWAGFFRMVRQINLPWLVLLIAFAYFYERQHIVAGKIAPEQQPFCADKLFGAPQMPAHDTAVHSAYININIRIFYQIRDHIRIQMTADNGQFRQIFCHIRYFGCIVQLHDQIALAGNADNLHPARIVK